MPAAPFADRARFDARDKVLGVTKYAADVPMPGMLFAMTVPATIAKGRMTGLATDAAMRIPGVVRVLTQADFPPPPPFEENGPPPPPPTLTQEIAYRGQPVALVVAETIEAAIEGAEAVKASYEAEPFASVIDSEGAKRQDVEPKQTGDALAALASAAAAVEGRYEVPTQHHNPIELIATTAAFTDGRLVIRECNQGIDIVKGAVSGALGLDPAKVEVKSETIGGGFGQKGFAQRQTALVAQAAILTGRPVKLVTPRGQVFHLASYRPRSRHHIRLGADADGRMTALAYEAVQENIANGVFAAEGYHETPPSLYGFQNYLGTAANVELDRQMPGYMRGTHPHAACFALESAVDELAYKLGRDPVALRVASDTAIDSLTKHPLSSRFLNECLTEGARRFGWDRRSPAPGSMTLPDGTLVGWGVASGIYQMSAAPGEATFRIGADGSARFSTSGHEMGQGIRTVIANAILGELDIDPDRLEIVIGDTAAGPQFITAGQWGTASVIPVTVNAVAQMKAALSELFDGRTPNGNVHQQLARVKRPYLEIKASALAPGQGPEVLDEFRQGGFVVAGPEFPEFTSMSYIAHFVEVHVEPRARRIRVPRTVSIADCGRVVSPRTARSQMHGGIVWAVGQALLEETEIDPRFGGYLNSDLADYVVPVNADIGEIEVDFIDRPDPLVSQVGAKGLGELVLVGASAAIANAVFHATGRRLHKLPIRIEDLL